MSCIEDMYKQEKCHFLWHNGIMSTIVEIDKAGRIVVPKKLRDALHLAPGTQLKLERSGDGLVLRPNSTQAQLVIENGVPLIYAAGQANVPVLTNEMVNALIEAGRQERERQVLGLDEDTSDDLHEETA
jgi:AbrB family looped-hinge helix DNA binding protein